MPEVKPEVKKTVIQKLKEEQKIFNELYDRLSDPIPDSYIIEYNEDGKKFKGYNAQAAINRLNDVVGINRWHTVSEIRKEEIINKAWAVSMQVKIVIKVLGQTIQAQGNGGSYAKNIANAYKGARTSAFKNACRYLGIGKELYTNEFDDDIDIGQGVEIKEESSTGVAIPKEIEELEAKIKICKTIEELQALQAEVSKIKTEPSQKIIIKVYNDKKISLMS